MGDTRTPTFAALVACVKMLEGASHTPFDFTPLIKRLITLEAEILELKTVIEAWNRRAE